MIFRTIISTIAFSITILLSQQEARTMQPQEILLTDFSHSAETESWQIINDGVMGGRSQSEVLFTADNTTIFKGLISLDNNGGFASTRSLPRRDELAGYKGIMLKVKGDGKNYQFRLRTNDRFDGISYRALFATEKAQWITVTIAFDEFVPVFRGRILTNVAPLVPENIQQLGFLIANKKAEQFQIEIDWIKAYRDQ